MKKLIFYAFHFLLKWVEDHLVIIMLDCIDFIDILLDVSADFCQLLLVIHQRFHEIPGVLLSLWSFFENVVITFVFLEF